MDTLGNLALLEKKINHDLGQKKFNDKTESYKQSAFALTRDVANQPDWTEARIVARTEALGELACAT